MADSLYNPTPDSVPQAAEHHIVAAVFNPLTETPSFKISPPPKKTIPETICAAMREGSPLTDVIA